MSTAVIKETCLVPTPVTVIEAARNSKLLPVLLFCTGSQLSASCLVIVVVPVKGDAGIGWIGVLVFASVAANRNTARD